MRAVPKLTFEEMEERAQLTKEWTKYKQKQNAVQMSAIRGLLAAQQKALDELRSESVELYLEALKVQIVLSLFDIVVLISIFYDIIEYFFVILLYLQLDEGLFPLERKGPFLTPPLKGYEAPDGDWTETTKKYDKR